ncbi:hypothetical protein AX16_000592 [Volvariella volvacea WC 439]|nr:hypothetical protein AX16_000592 [Volvariella volvacea WC 439]
MSSAKGKGKARATNAVPLLPVPASGSANPAASLSSLWAYIQPALDHIVKSPTNDPSGKAPAIDVGFYAGIHSACYNYFTMQSEAIASTRSIDASTATSGTDIYEQLDRYFADAARELVLGAPQDDATLVHYLIPCLNRYTAGAQSANRLLNYVNRHYVKRAIDEDRGWLRLTDILESIAKTISLEDSREKIAKKLKERKMEELKKWGYEEGGSSESMATAEACAEAASAPDRIVPVLSLAMRRLRTECIEPLLATPKVKGKPKGKHKIPKNDSSLPQPRSRLGRALKALQESDDIDELHRRDLIVDLAKTLRLVGVRPDHVLRKKLDRLAASYY